MRRALLPAAVLLCSAMTLGAQARPKASGASLLNHRTLLTRQQWWDNRDWSWYEANIPFFDSPDADINATYYYRWQLLTKHLTYGSTATGYTFTEFIDRPFWSGAYGAISCPLGHQLYEARWLHDQRIVGDFARYWFETPGAEPRSYSNWYGDAVYAAFMVNGDRSFLGDMLPHMEAQYAGWMAEHWDSTAGMFHWDGMHDGMETNINSRLTVDEFSGADGYRPTINAYLYGDEMAISRAAAILGQPDKSRHFASLAADLKQRVQQQLWDPTREFFFHQFRSDEKGGITAGSLTYQSGPYAGNPHGREQIGYVPWQFNLPDSGYEAAWKFLRDTAYFAAPFGPTTVERHDPQFRISPRCCVWSGNAWPYATTQTLVAMANLLDNYHQSVVDKNDYFRLFKTYTLDQRKNGRPYIAEAADPDNGSWEGHDTFDHSEHYFHSGYTDLVITGIVGLRPRADDSLEVQPLAPDSWDYFALDNVRYHGHDVAVVWDRTGARYHRGAGLTLLVDGRVIGRAPRLGQLMAVLPAPEARGFDREAVRGRPDMLLPADTATAVGRPRTTTAGSRPGESRQVNLAVNNGDPEGAEVWTSYSAPGTSPHFLNDGNYWYSAVPPNRWTTAGSPHASDTITIAFRMPARLDSVRLYFLDDSLGVRRPATYDLAVWHNGAWRALINPRRVPAQPTGHRANTVSFTRVTTTRLRVVLRPLPGSAVGLTEVEAWGAPPTSCEACLSVPWNVANQAEPSASFTSQFDGVTQINDAKVAFSHYSRNRWTAFGTPNASDWVELDLHEPYRVGRVELYLWGDGGGVKAPKRYVIQFWNGSGWTDATVRSQVPAIPLVSSVNTVNVVPFRTSRVRIRFEHDLPAASGVTEIRILEATP